MINSSAKHISPRVLKTVFYLALFFSFYFNIYAVPLFDLDEGAFSEATREMFARNDFISTYLNNAPRYDKPILVYWLQAASATLFGFNEFAMRLPSAVAATLWMLAIVFFVRRVKDEQTAWTAGIIGASSLLISVIGKSATADALLNMLLATSMLSLYLYMRDHQRKFLLGFYVCASLGFLAKGPVALFVPAAVSFLFLVSQKRWKDWLLIAFNPFGIVLFCVIALPWYVLQYQKEGQAFIEGFFFTHNVARFQGSMEGHAGSLFYYVPVLLLGLLPFSAVLLKLTTQLRVLWRGDLERFMLIWFAFVLVFFSLSGTKLPHYINYGLTGVVILLSVATLHVVQNKWLVFLPLGLWLVFLLLLPTLIEVIAPTIAEPYFHESLLLAAQYFDALYYFIGAIMLCVVVYFLVENKLSLQSKLLMSGVVSVLSISLLVLPAMGAVLQQPVKDAALFARAHKYENIVMWKINMPSFSFYQQQVVERRDPMPGDIVFTASAYLEHARYPVEVLYRNGAIVLARIAQPVTQ